MISIIVPIYNAEKYLNNCINSVINQTYQDWKLLLINDGSTDNSLEICKKYSEIDSRIIIFSQENKGQASARNLGLNNVNTKYITFLDADDALEENTLEENIKILLQNDCIDFLQFPYYRDYGCEDQKLITYNPEFLTKEFYKNWLIKKKISWFVWDKIYKKELFNNLRFTEGVIFEDNLMVAHLLENARKIYISNKGIYNYYRRENSTTTSKITLKKEQDSYLVTSQIAKILYSNEEYNLYHQFLVRCYNIKKSLKTNFGKKVDFEFEYSLSEILKSELNLKDKIKLLSLKYAN